MWAFTENRGQHVCWILSQTGQSDNGADCERIIRHDEIAYGIMSIREITSRQFYRILDRLAAFSNFGGISRLAEVCVNLLVQISRCRWIGLFHRD